MNDDDLRVKRTRRLLREAFVQLVIAHGYESLTVRQITKQAQVGYKTFYRHYESKDALLKAILEALVQDLQQALSRIENPPTPIQNTMTALAFTKNNADLFRALTQSPGGDQLLEPMLQMALQEGSLFLGNMDVPDELAVYHFASSIDALVKWWLKHDMPYSIEEMATYINRLVIQPMQQLMQENRWGLR